MVAASHKLRVWDPLVRIFHWSLAACFLLNTFIFDNGKQTHEILGEIALGLLAFRVIWGFIGPHNARFSTFMPTTAGIRLHLSDLFHRRLNPHEGHNPLGGIMILTLLGLMIATGTTGWMLKNIDFFWGEDWFEDIHEALAELTLVAVVIHVSAIVLIERWTQVPLIKPMITGIRKLPDDGAPLACREPR